LIAIHPASDLDVVRELFREYQAGVDAPVCFATFDTELAGLPAPYSTILLAEVDGTPAGCVALKPLADGHGEIKRLYVRPAFRRLGLGEQLVQAVIDTAKLQGHRSVRLDTLPFMSAAIELYRRLGFTPIARYNDTPDPGTLFFELSFEPRHTVD
jgi:ribosomal protein S18 acetylase RimI-like enzyme